MKKWSERPCLVKAGYMKESWQRSWLAKADYEGEEIERPCLSKAGHQGEIERFTPSESWLYEGKLERPYLGKADYEKTRL
jgi:hypothetical protein